MRRAGKLIIIIGILLILVSFGFMLYWHISSVRAELDVSDTLIKLKELLPPESIGNPEEFFSMEMPVLELDGRDIIGLLSIPQADTELPVAADWNKRTLIALPQRFSGSTYDSSLIIGGYDQKGQFDCLKNLDIGNEIFVTDMTGAKFSYTVSDIQRKKSASYEVLSDPASDLTLFVRDDGSADYIIVRCIRQISA